MTTNRGGEASSRAMIGRESHRCTVEQHAHPIDVALEQRQLHVSSIGSNNNGSSGNTNKIKIQPENHTISASTPNSHAKESSHQQAQHKKQQNNFITAADSIEEEEEDHATATTVSIHNKLVESPTGSYDSNLSANANNVPGQISTTADVTRMKKVLQIL